MLASEIFEFQSPGTSRTRCTGFSSPGLTLDRNHLPAFDPADPESTVAECEIGCRWEIVDRFGDSYLKRLRFQKSMVGEEFDMQ
jgi:hypothetical protein